MAEKTLRQLKIVMLVSSLLCLLFLGMAAVEENMTGDWRRYQSTYKNLSFQRAETATAKAAAERMPVGFVQYFLPEMSRIDRCATCHIAVDDPRMKDQSQPLRTHSGDILTHHPTDKFGCTVCHQGQGRAVLTDAAHGEVPHWEEPLLRGPRVYRSCGQCHYENDLFGAEDDLYTRSGKKNPIDRSEVHASIPGATSISNGKQLVVEKGCLGCHEFRGRGGTLGPEITYVGDKTVHDYDFSNLHGERTVEDWLFQHFKHPDQVSPGSVMPEMDLSDEEARQLTEYMLSLRRKTMPAQFTPVPPRRSGEAVSGHELYQMFCSSCHGTDGKGSTVRDAVMAARSGGAPRQLMVPSLSNSDTLATASDGFLRHIINRGRPGTSMIAWGDSEGGGLTEQEVEALVQYIRSWQSPGPDIASLSASLGDPKAGRSIYRFNCAGCHGRQGQGGIGTQLNSSGFLSIASDLFLARTLVTGRHDTAMPSFRQLSAQQLNDVMAYLRSWHPLRSDTQKTLQLVEAGGIEEGVSSEIGETFYRANCVTCHGSNGAGDLGPSLNAPEFLTRVDDLYLYRAITAGRPGTGMPAWRHFSSPDVASMIRYIRSWQTEPLATLPTESLRGDWDAGKLLYAGMCAGCHGTQAEGGVGPQLSNPIFLDSSSDMMLYHWIAYGKTGTAMRPFLKGQQGAAELSPSQIVNIVSYLRSLQRQTQTAIMRSPNGRPELGETWFASSCSGCHGVDGEGASGPALTNSGFLKAASDGFLLASMVVGREGTPMRPVKKGAQSILDLTSDQVNDIVAFLRSRENVPQAEGVPHRFVIPWDLGRGKSLYLTHCSGCHGQDGRPEAGADSNLPWAPALNNPEFLAAATDGYLQATIARGRNGTAMRPFGEGAQGVSELPAQDIDDIVAYMRQWSTFPKPPMTVLAEKDLALQGNPTTQPAQNVRESQNSRSGSD